MRKCFFGVSISPETLGEPEPSGEAFDDGNEPPAAVTADTEGICIVPVTVQSVSADVETDQELEILQGLTKRIELIRQPKVREADIEQRGEDDSGTDSEQPEPGVMSECFGRVQHEDGHDDDQRQRVGIAGDGQLVRVEECQD